MPEKPFAPSTRPDRQPREQILTVRVNHDELQTLHIVAATRLYTVSELIRECIYETLIRNKPAVHPPKIGVKKA
jgi:hypothetical protein